MITFYFDTNLRTLIQSPGNQAPASAQTWVYGDNYNCQVYVVQAGVYLPISASDTLTAMLYQPAASNPQQQLAIIGTPQHLTDANGNNYFSLNVNLATTQLAAITQTPNKPAVCQFHFVLNPADLERFSESQDVQTTVNPDPTQSATGGTAVPPGYPPNPNVFEQVANKNAVGGYVGLDATGHLNPAQIPTDTTLTVTGGKLSAIGGAGGNPYVGVIPATFIIPAEGANVSVTLGAAVPDIVAGASLSITDGVRFINVLVATISGTALTVTNNGAPGAVTGTMGVNSHVYMGSTAGPTDTTRRGTAQQLPAVNPTTSFYRGDDSFAIPVYASLASIPSTFAPSPHANSHLTTGGDAIALATVSTAGLCPPPDGSTIVITGGKLVSTVSGGTGNPYVAIIPASFVVPAVGSTVVVTMDAAHADFTLGMSVAIADGGTHIFNAIVTLNSGTSLTLRNSGSVNNAAVGATIAAGSHVYVGNVSDLATSTAPGIVRPDGTTITIGTGANAGILTATGGIGQHGARRKNVTVANVISAPSAFLTLNFDTAAAPGFDTDGYWTSNTTITIPTGQAGYYEVGCCVAWPIPVTNQNFLGLGINLNGNGMVYDQRTPLTVSGISGLFSIQNLATVLHLAVGDAITFVAMFGVSSGTPTLTIPSNAGQPCAWAMRIS